VAVLLAVCRQAYVAQHLGPATAALHKLPVACGQLCEQGRYWRLVFSSSQRLRDVSWWRAGAKQLLRSCTGSAQAPAAAAAGSSSRSAPLHVQQVAGPDGVRTLDHASSRTAGECARSPPTTVTVLPCSTLVCGCLTCLASCASCSDKKALSLYCQSCQLISSIPTSHLPAVHAPQPSMTSNYNRWQPMYEQGAPG
jgi:hypothetical protein